MRQAACRTEILIYEPSKIPSENGGCLWQEKGKIFIKEKTAVGKADTAFRIPAGTRIVQYTEKRIMRSRKS